MPSLRKPLTRLLKSQIDSAISQEDMDSIDESILLQFNQLKQVTLNHHYHHHKHKHTYQPYQLQLQFKKPYQLQKLLNLRQENL